MGLESLGGEELKSRLVHGPARLVVVLLTRLKQITKNVSLPSLEIANRIKTLTTWAKKGV